MARFAFLLLIGCAAIDPPASPPVEALIAPPPLPPIVCGFVPDGDWCCVSVAGQKLIQQCRQETRQHQEMQRRALKDDA